MKFSGKIRPAAGPSTRSLVWWSFAMLLPAARYLGIVLNLNYLVPGVLCFLVWAALPRTGKAVTDRAVIYSFVAALALTAFGNYLGTMERQYYPFSFYFLRLRVTGPLTLFGAALAARYRKKEHLLGLSALALFLAFGVGWDTGDGTMLRRVWRLGPWESSFPTFYRWHALPSLAALAGAVFWYGRPFRFRTLFRFGAVLAAALCLAAAGLRFQRHHRDRLQSFSDTLVSFGWKQPSATNPWGSRRALLGGDVKQPNPPETPAERSVILFYVHSPKPPRYWRMTVLSHYRRGSWESVDGEHLSSREVMPELITDDQPVKQADQRYFLTDPPFGQLVKTELYFGRWRNPAQLPLPGNAAILELVADAVTANRNGLVSANGMVTDAGMTVYCDPVSAEAGQEPLPPGLEELDVPRNLRNFLRNTLLLAGVMPGETDRETAARLIRYLQERCHYSQNWPGSPFFRDPVQFFLEEHPSGHCELFASALVLLLRQAGIPARYVAGALCYEKAGGRDRYVIRRRHLHAWAETFDRDRGEWVLLDPTPGSDNETAAETTEPEGAERWRLFWHYHLAAFLAALRRGHWIGWLAGPAYAAYEKITANPGPWLWSMGIILAAGAAFRHWRSRRRERRTRAYLVRELNHCGRFLARRGVIAGNAARRLTAAELLLAVERTSRLTETERRETMAFLRNYLKRRFG